MLTVHEANLAHLFKQAVVYHNGQGWESGYITAVMQHHAFVRYNGDNTSKYTALEDLSLEMP
jgi:hypothetical protein